MSFTHLHVHSDYSLCDGLFNVEKLAAHAARCGAPAVALTDLGNLFGAIKFYNAAIQHGVKPIIGCELKLFLDESEALVAGVKRGDESFCSVVALCMNRTGYRNLTQLVTRTYLEGKTFEGPLARRQWLEELNEGLIVLSGGVRGDVGRWLRDGDESRATAAVQFWRRIFQNRYYLEVYLTERESEDDYFRRVLQFAAREQLPLVATNDVCFLKESDFEAHEARVCISRGGYTLKDAARPRIHSRKQYFKTTVEMGQLFTAAPEALQNTEEIAKRCTLKLQQGGILLPEFEVPQGMTAQQHLVEQAVQGLAQRLDVAPPQGDGAYRQRLEHELEVISRMGYAGYFLIVADFVRWAKDQSIPVGPGRGSGAGSLVAYALGITELDPLEYDLLFERFLNPDRISPPDLDIDLCMDNRDRVIEYVAERYGGDKVCQIITFGRFVARIVVRDVGRVLDNPYGYVDKLAKLIPDDLNITLDDALAKSPELKQRYQTDDMAKAILDTGRQLEGLVRNPGTHAGGVIISPKALTEYTALYSEYKGPTVVTQLDMKDLEAIGLVKFDLLGLRTLTTIQYTIDTIKQYTGKTVVLKDIPLDDIEVYRFLQTGETRAIFQLESEGIRQLIRNLKPDCFADIIALLALYRPGPLKSGMVENYIKCKHGAQIEYPHPKLEPILRLTYGVILYQEQVMQIARDLSGYTLGAADILRRAMGKKLPDEMLKQRDDFINGAVERGVAQPTAARIFSLIENFADYGFNKAHSTAYALIAYHTAWFKTHYPAAFMAAVMSVDMRNTDKLAEMVYECRDMQIKIKPPDINRSQSGFTVLDDSTVLYGLGAVRTVGSAMVQCIIDERERHGAYQSLSDFCVRNVPHGVRKNTIEPLLCAGALDSLGQTRCAMLGNFARLYSRAEAQVQDRLVGQDSLFGDDEVGAADITQEIPSTVFEGEEISHDTQMHMEKGVLGFYLSDHPVNHFAQELKQMTKRRLKDASEIQAFKGQRNQAPVHRLAGVIIDAKRRGQRGRGALFTLDDGTQRITMSVYDDDYDRYKHLLSNQGVVIVGGRKILDVGRTTSRWYATYIFTLDEARLEFAKSLLIGVAPSVPAADFPSHLKVLLEPYVAEGRCPVRVRLSTGVAYTELELGENWQVKPCNDLFLRAKSLAAIDDVRLIY